MFGKKDKPEISVGFTHDAEGKPRKIEVVPVDEFGKTKVMYHGHEVVTSEGRFFEELVTKWGMVMGKPDGEDSSGRARMTIMPVEEVVERAATTTALAFTRMRKEGWLESVPTFAEIEDQLATIKKNKKNT